MGPVDLSYLGVETWAIYVCGIYYPRLLDLTVEEYEHLTLRTRRDPLFFRCLAARACFCRYAQKRR